MKKRPLKRRLGILGKYPGLFTFGMFIVAAAILTAVYFHNGVDKNEKVEGASKVDTAAHIEFEEQEEETSPIEVPGMDDELSGRTKPRTPAEPRPTAASSSEATTQEGETGAGEASEGNEGTHETQVVEPTQDKSTAEPKPEAKPEPKSETKKQPAEPKSKP